MEYGSPNKPSFPIVGKLDDSSLPAVITRHGIPRSALTDFLHIKAALQRQTGVLIDRAYDDIVLRAFVYLVCSSDRSMDLEIKTSTRDIFSRYCGPVPRWFKERVDETVDDGRTSDFDRAVSALARRICAPLGNLAVLLSNEEIEGQYEQIRQLSTIADVIQSLWAALRMPPKDEFLEPGSDFIDFLFPTVVMQWRCRSALIVYSRIKKELQRQVSELIDREDNSDELRIFIYGVRSGSSVSMEDAIRTSAHDIFSRYFGCIPQWYKAKEAEKRDETEDEMDDDMEDMNLNVSLFCEEVEELLVLFSVGKGEDRSPQIQQLIWIAHHIKDFKRYLEKVGSMPVEEEEDIMAEGKETEGEAVVSRTKVRSLEEKQEEEMSLVKKHEEEEEERSERAGEEMSFVKKHEEEEEEEEQSKRAGKEMTDETCGEEVGHSERAREE